MIGRRVAAVAIAGALTGAAGMLSGCTDSSHPTSSHRSTASHHTVAPADARLATARRLAAQYDYAGAEKTLAHDHSPAARKLVGQARRSQAATKAWPDTTLVSHVFYHSIIVDPDRAFAKGQEQRDGYAQFMVTMHEFKAQLQQIYRRGYVLVHPQRLVAKDASGTMRPATLKLPPGKKPLVLSFDDTNYYEYMKGAGFAKNLTVKDGKVTNTYVDAGGATHYGAYDGMTVIDQFIKKHPDFSYRGDKGTMAVTGYNGVLGYRSSVKEYGDKPTTHAEQRRAKTTADALKAEGWQFASHTWGHINLTTAALPRIKADAKRWDDEVRPIVGKTDEIVYPFGADISGMKPYSSSNAKFDFLHGTEGFDYFFPIDDSTPAWSQVTPQSWRQARINVDGISMQRELDGEKTPVGHLFDTRSTIDPKRPLPVPK